MCTLDWVKLKASVLKGIFGRWTKDVFYLLQYKPPDVTYTALIDHSSDMHVNACLPGKGTPNGTILPGRGFLLTM